MAAKNDHFIFYIAFATMISCYFLPNRSWVEAQRGGFSVELIHRDSPKSPFFNQLETTSERTINALWRSVARLNRFTPTYISKTGAQSDIRSNQGEYLMNISIGTPPFEILAIADTGSDLIWTQCHPCAHCYKQEVPLFDPKSSYTYRKLPCSSRQCQTFPHHSCSIEANDTCLYSIFYGDKSFSNGDLAIDTITLGSSTGGPTITLPKTIIGCGHNNEGSFSEKGSGIIGLGGGAVSLISQMSSLISGKFSYCLVPFSSESGISQIHFGTNAVVSGSGVVSTPLIKKPPEVFYFLTLEAISVDDDKLEFTGSSLGTSEGNIIIDSGTTLTLFPQDFYSKLEASVASKIDAKRIDAPIESLRLCYEANRTDELRVPNITMHFRNADVKLSPLNTFLLVSEGISCFTFSSFQGLAIYGNLAQMNFLVGYDIENQAVSFKPTQCS
ncbi:hypothetical protein Golob_001402 [Gossypium lobatum]|uniref:Peptidase A1 domain-containing protein n=1 Tax=Gossypium lobatum TaxID=34289 RepID=A0A7J8NBD1_9ROSI|nr:hypothetical protein [Gossypium lobatum]